MPEEPEDWLDASVSYIPEAPAAAYLPDPPADPPPASPPGASSTVYITDTGEKYHSGGCSYLKESKHAIGLDDALSQGYTACSRCDP
jgi:competence protein ComEC